MKRVLMISPVPLYPTNDGGRVRVHEIATHLTSRYEVHVAAPRGDRPPSESFAVHATRSQGIQQMLDPRVLLHLEGIIRRVRPDALLLEYIWLGLHVAPLARIHGIPLIVDAWDVATSRMRRAGRRIWPAVNLYERAVMRLADRVFVTSETDRDAITRLGAPASGVEVVANGVNTRVFRPGPPEERRAARQRLGMRDSDRMLFFFGQLSYAPNSDAVSVLAREIMPRLSPNYRLIVAGRGPIEELRRRYASDRVAFTGAVDDLVPYIRAADVVPVPITHGSGTRLKILESVACGVPTVSTPVGCEGIDLAACGASLRVRSDWGAFARSVDEAARAQHEQPSAAFVDRYDWRSIVARIEL